MKTNKKNKINKRKKINKKNNIKTRKIVKNKKENEKNNKFKKLNCSPINQTNKIQDYSCYDKNDLNKLKIMWNERHPDKPIKTNNPKIIWTKLKDYLINICNKESCWVRQLVKNTKLEKELLESFAPKSPYEWKINPNEWLSSLDILSVMNQYEQKYDYFEFMGPSPIDFDYHNINNQCVWEELCSFNLNELIKKGKKKIGIIFNTDPHYKSGSHWISLFINIDKGEIFFFDSVGNKIPKEIMKLVNKIKKQGNQLKEQDARNKTINFIFDQNYPKEHQLSSSECGLYSLYFIISMLEDKIDGNYLKKNTISDKSMQDLRKIYFNEDL